MTFFLLMFLWNNQLKNVVVENHGLLSGIDIVSYVINPAIKTLLNPNAYIQGLHHGIPRRSKCGTIAYATSPYQEVQPSFFLQIRE